MDEVIEGVLKGILHLLSFIVRGLVWLIIEFFNESIAWYVGWPIVRMISLGKYPRESVGDLEKASSFVKGVVSIVGFVALILLGTVLAKLIIYLGT